MGGIYTPTHKNWPLAKGYPDTPDTGVRTLRTQRNLRTENSYSETPSICADTLDFVSGHSRPGVSGLIRDTLKNIILKWFVWLTSI
jgi:hypothetical protein